MQPSTSDKLTGGSNPPPTFYAIPMGYREELLKAIPDAQLIEIDTNTPISHQLVMIPKGVKIQPLVPSGWTPEAGNYFLTLVYQGAIAYQITQNTYHAFMPLWINNSLENTERFHNCEPINNIPRNPKKDFALIIGNGPSLLEHLHEIPENAEIFACWHAAKKLTDAGIFIDYVGHIDPFGYDNWEYNFHPDTAFIGSPQASPRFINITKGKPLYGFYEPSNPCNAHFAKLHGVTDSHHVVGTVCHMLLSSAIYAGHKEVAVLGWDNAWVEGNYEYNTTEEPKKLTNKQGQEIMTYSAFETESHGLYSTSILHPDVKIWQTSEIALDVPRIEYKPLKDFHVTHAD